MRSVILAIIVMVLALLPESGCSKDASRKSPSPASVNTESADSKNGDDMANTINTANRLTTEKSPYLLQHANNPVDWFPWGDEAFEKAARENLPIFLSIGYSTCHWCHVMEKESFENEEVAKILNAHFVAIKVDREERPDIDAAYMAVCQAMTGSGGWPLTIIMTPDKKPFFAATYLPADDKFSGEYGMKGLKTLLPEIAKVWKDRRKEVDAAAEKIVSAVSAETRRPPSESVIVEKTSQDAAKAFYGSYDEFYGGFGMQGPKFPTPHVFSFLLRYWKRTGDANALDVATHSLRRIAWGGIHDHVGGGFARYSTDRVWLVPHFEKMLYDQALLATAYLEAFQATGNQEFADAATDIFKYVLRDLSSPEGAFYSAEDADSEGEEGKFYVWTEAEIDELLPQSVAVIFKKYFNVTGGGNFERGANILHVSEALDVFAEENRLDKDKFAAQMTDALETLFKAREKRPRPHLDDKILTSWNGLMIGALARGARALNRPDYALEARKAAGFILSEMYKDGELSRRYRDGEVAVPGFLDDYAFLADGLLELYEATYDVEYLKAAKEIAGSALKKFGTGGGALSLSSGSHERLIKSAVEAYDGAEPSGNSVAAGVLLKLGKLTSDKKMFSRGEEIIDYFADDIRKYPTGHARMLCAIEFHISPPVEIVFAGPATDATVREFIRIYNGAFLPTAISVLSAPESPLSDALVPFSYSKEQIDGQPAAYLCRNYSCRFPTTDPAQFKDLLNQNQ